MKYYEGTALWSGPFVLWSGIILLVVVMLGLEMWEVLWLGLSLCVKGLR